MSFLEKAKKKAAEAAKKVGEKGVEETNKAAKKAKEKLE
jgi:hypothetical protein